MNPYVLGAVALGLLVSHASMYVKGGNDEENKQKAAYSRQLEKAMEMHNENAARDVQTAFEAGQKQARARVVTRTIQQQVDKVVERAVYRDCRLDDDGLRLWNAANAGAETPPPAKPDPAPAKLPRIN